MSDTSHSGGMGGGLVPAMYPPPSSLRPTLVGEDWSVVAGHPLVSQIAAEVFSSGGNAVDAGVAAGLASNVVQVDMANFGGIAPILIRPPASPNCYSVAGVGRWSSTAHLEEIRSRYAGSLPLGGPAAIVPGAPAAWLSALAAYGTKSFADVAGPAIALAHDGFLLDRRSAQSLELTGQSFRQWPESQAIYRPGDTPLAPGDRLRQPALGDLLQRMVDGESSARGTREEKIRGAHEVFYRGDVAHQITQWVLDNGGYMSPEDFYGFEAEIEQAPTLRVGAWTFASTPSWSQGPVALEILGLLSRTSGSWHELVESITLAFNDREDHLAAPGQMRLPLEELLGSQRLDELAKSIGPQALPGRAHPGSTASTLGSTTAVVTMDKAGGTFATAPSDTLDGGPIIEPLGILCSPRGVQSRLEPEHANRLEPGGRPCVTPAALIGLSGESAWAMACPGGDVIVQAMAQVIWRVIHDGMDLQEAVEAPRIAAFNAPSAFHPHPSADRLVFAESRIGPEAIRELETSGHRLEVWPEFEFDAGSVQTIMLEPNHAGEAVLRSAADPRRSAYGIAR